MKETNALPGGLSLYHQMTAISLLDDVTQFFFKWQYKRDALYACPPKYIILGTTLVWE